MARLLTAQDAESIVTVTESDLRIDDPDADTSYTLRLLPEKKLHEIQRAHTKKRPNAQGQMVEVIDHEAVGVDVADWVIKDWSGIVVRDGDGRVSPVPCVRDAKLGLDPYVRRALIDYATRNQRAEAQARAESFRSAP